MNYFLRQLVSFLLLPGVVTIVVPLWLARANGLALTPPANPLASASLLLGIPVGAVGIWLFAYSLAHFVSHGRGTLAPWDPPRKLVISGPYRYVRNPMIAGVCFIVVAEALLLRSAPHAWWAAAVVLMNVIYIPLIEEPGLRARFGEDYSEYCRNVRRLVPRLRPRDSKSEFPDSNVSDR